MFNLHPLLHMNRAEQEMDDELRFHLEKQIEQNVARGMSKEEARHKFEFLLGAFEYGAPPHGGCAPGVDRIVMILENEPNIREVIPFAKTGEGKDLMMGAPSEIAEKQMRELGIELRTKKK